MIRAVAHLMTDIRQLLLAVDRGDLLVVCIGLFLFGRSLYVPVPSHASVLALLDFLELCGSPEGLDIRRCIINLVKILLSVQPRHEGVLLLLLVHSFLTAYDVWVRRKCTGSVFFVVHYLAVLEVFIIAFSILKSFTGVDPREAPLVTALPPILNLHPIIIGLLIFLPAGLLLKLLLPRMNHPQRILNELLLHMPIKLRIYIEAWCVVHFEEEGF